LNTNSEPLVLMADDDEDDCTLARNAFRESGARGVIRCLENGMELMDYLSHSNPVPGLIMLDLNMPIKDGRQALKEINSTPAFRHIPVVVFTTSRENKDIAYSVEMGAQLFITKPNTFGEWVSIMKSLADRWLAAVEQAAE
jgi:CheY-like chemotaxis protein